MATDDACLFLLLGIGGRLKLGRTAASSRNHELYPAESKRLAMGDGNGRRLLFLLLSVGTRLNDNLRRAASSRNHELTFNFLGNTPSVQEHPLNVEMEDIECDNVGHVPSTSFPSPDPLGVIQPSNTSEPMNDKGTGSRQAVRMAYVSCRLLLIMYRVNALVCLALTKQAPGSEQRSRQ